MSIRHSRARRLLAIPKFYRFGLNVKLHRFHNLQHLTGTRLLSGCILHQVPATKLVDPGRRPAPDLPSNGVR
jgi:hypothetical protein